MPAALENVIDEKNADNIKAKIVVEGANGPTTPKADEILLQKKIMLVPDILFQCWWCNRLLLRMGPGPAVLLLDTSEVNERLRQVMTSAYSKVRALADHKEVDMRTAADMIAMGDVAEAIQCRAYFPDHQRP